MDVSSTFERQRVVDAASPLVDRVRAAYPCGSSDVVMPVAVASALDVLSGTVARRKRGNVLQGMWNGLTAGSFDEDGYANLAGNVGRGIGQLVSGLLVYGDARDAVASLSRHEWLNALLASVSLIPAAGDVGDVVSLGTREARAIHDGEELAEAVVRARRAVRELEEAEHVVEEIRRLERAEDIGILSLEAHERFGNSHTLELHVIAPIEELQRRVLTTDVRGAGKFTDLATADAAVEKAIAARADLVRRVVATGRGGRTFTVDVGEDVGVVVTRDALKGRATTLSRSA